MQHITLYQILHTWLNQRTSENNFLAILVFYLLVDIFIQFLWNSDLLSGHTFRGIEKILGMHISIKTIHFQKSQKSSFFLNFQWNDPKTAMSSHFELPIKQAYMGMLLRKHGRVLFLLFYFPSSSSMKLQNPPVLQDIFGKWPKNDIFSQKCISPLGFCFSTFAWCFLNHKISVILLD